MKKAPLIALAVVLLVVLVAVVYTRTSETTQVANTDQAQSPADSMADTVDGTLPVATDSMTPAAATTPSKATPKLAYEEAVKRYGAQRIQFNAQCQATPNSSTFKSGLEIMLDNRAGVERSIAFSGKTYKIPAYDYAVVTLSAKGIIYIDCGTSQNVAKLTVQ